MALGKISKQERRLKVRQDRYTEALKTANPKLKFHKPGSQSK